MFENVVCKMLFISSQAQCVNKSFPSGILTMCLYISYCFLYYSIFVFVINQLHDWLGNKMARFGRFLGNQNHIVYMLNTESSCTSLVLRTDNMGCSHKEYYMYSSDELFQRSRKGYFLCLFPELQSNNSSESTYIILFLTRYNVSINDDKNNNLYTSSPCLTCLVFILLMTSQSIADDVTIMRQL